MLIALIAAHLLIQAGLAFAIYRNRERIRHKRLVVAGLFVVLIAWTFLLSDSSLLYKIAPNKYGVVVYDLFPLFVTAIFAILTAAYPRSFVRWSIYGLLWFVMNFHFFGAAIYSPIHCGNEWDGACCLQTTDSTCAAAAAATLLKLNGIDAREDEMTRLCFSSANGTSFWGLYHGMRDRADLAEKSVVVENMPCQNFLERNEPALVYVMLTRDADARDKRYARDWGWTVNVSHAVVFLGKTASGGIRIADPKIGVEEWNEDGLKTLWRNKVIYVR